MKEPFVSVVIRTRNRLESLKRAISSIQKSKNKKYEIVIVDDCSTDGTREFLESKYSNSSKFKLVRNKAHISSAYSYNQGVKHADGNIIVFIDDDCIADEDLLKKYIDYYKIHKEVVGVFGKVYIGNSIRVQNPTKASLGCNMSFKSQIFQKYLFDENLIWSHLQDETEFVERLRQNNLKIGFAAKAIVNHFQEPAGYRSNAAIGQIINNIYKSAKQKKLIKYYLSYLTEFFKQNNEMPILGHLKILLNEVHKSNQWAKLPWILYALFIEIPVRSRLQRRFEKRYMEGKIR